LGSGMRWRLELVHSLVFSEHRADESLRGSSSTRIGFEPAVVSESPVPHAPF
jgi:hypothetical protein